MTKPSPTSERIAWAIDARARSQRLLLALFELGERHDYGLTEKRLDPEEDRNAELFPSLASIAFSLWRAAFQADMATRGWSDAVRDAQQLLGTVLATNTVAFGPERDLPGWTGGYYLTNAKLRLQHVSRRLQDEGRATEADVARLEAISLINTNPHETWTLFCDEAERLAERIGCTRR
jgi:hypothetical protein